MKGEEPVSNREGLWRTLFLADAHTPPVFMPDIGTFFNQDVELAKEWIHTLHEANVQVLKGELLHDARICLDDDTMVSYLAKDGSPHQERYRALIERKVVPLERYADLFEEAKSLGMDIVVSIYDHAGIDFALELGVSAIKIATSNIVHQPLIEYAAQSGKPLLFDTGDSTLEEADRALSWARDIGARDLIVQHSPYPPPASVERHDLRFMVTLGQALGTPYGLSDHHAGNEMLYAATALGARVLEKGVCPDDLEVEQDVAHALPLSQVGAVLRSCNAIHAALGRSFRTLERQRPKKLSRMGLVAAKDVAIGETLGRDSTYFAFPATGIEVEHWQLVQGRRFRRRVRAGTPISWDDVED